MQRKLPIKKLKYEIAQEFGLAQREENEQQKRKLKGKIKRTGKRF